LPVIVAPEALVVNTATCPVTEVKEPVSPVTSVPDTFVVKLPVEN